MMELNFADTAAREKCHGKKGHVVAFVHAHLGLAAVVTVSDIPEKEALKLETARGIIFVDYHFTKVLE